MSAKKNTFIELFMIIYDAGVVRQDIQLFPKAGRNVNEMGRETGRQAGRQERHQGHRRAGRQVLANGEIT